MFCGSTLVITWSQIVLCLFDSSAPLVHFLVLPGTLGTCEDWSDVSLGSLLNDIIGTCVWHWVGDVGGCRAGVVVTSCNAYAILSKKLLLYLQP